MSVRPRSRTICLTEFEQEVDALLFADDPDEADQISPSFLPTRIRRRDAHAAKIGSASDDKHSILRHATALYGNLAIALVGGNDDIGEKERQPLKKYQQTPEDSASIEFRFVQLRIDVVMIKDVFLPYKLEGQGDKKDQIGRVAAVNRVESMFAEHAPGEPVFREQGACVFAQITDRRVAFHGERVSIDVDALEDFIVGFVTLALRADNGDERARVDERQSFLPDPAIERDRQILNNYKNFLSTQCAILDFLPGFYRYFHALNLA